ncbi:MAG: glycosyl transferase family 2 [Crocinitomicaceae bacterium]|nr:glycosyl transferase family 2 [Crocinitomicaceae bacterium]|tara:strand:+ start:16248 stop:17333 length:1086 start_codon:yes stop_codon:yes gene_type:complete
MINNKTIAVVVPCYNEESQIAMVVKNMPEFVDRIVVVNDFSKDQTETVVKSLINNEAYISSVEIKPKRVVPNPYNKADQVLEKVNNDEIKFYTPQKIEESKSKIVLINHLRNAGVGAAIASGYKWCKDKQIDCTAVMAGDGQMDPNELNSICRPVIEENIDYVKGNRLIHRSALLVIPKIRYLGNAILSILTKLASGYWHVSDTQTGYTAISNKALNAVKLYKIYKSYGMPNDLLVKLNIAFCTLREVEIKPVYNIGEQSKMNIFKVIPRVSFLLFKSFFKRLWGKYLFRDFHPLFLLYNMSFILFGFSIPFVVKISKIFISGGQLNTFTFLGFLFLFITAFQAFLFAMWMDIQDNERLYK